VFAEGLREHLSTPEPAGAVLLFRLPQGSPAVEEMEGATTLPKISQRQTEAASAMPPESEEEEGRWLRTNTICSRPAGWIWTWPSTESFDTTGLRRTHIHQVPRDLVRRSCTATRSDLRELWNITCGGDSLLEVSLNKLQKLLRGGYGP
jgi:hypothetical protein